MEFEIENSSWFEWMFFYQLYYFTFVFSKKTSIYEKSKMCSRHYCVIDRLGNSSGLRFVYSTHTHTHTHTLALILFANFGTYISSLSNSFWNFQRRKIQILSLSVSVCLCLSLSDSLSNSHTLSVSLSLCLSLSLIVSFSNSCLTISPCLSIYWSHNNIQCAVGMFCDLQ